MSVRGRRFSVSLASLLLGCFAAASSAPAAVLEEELRTAIRSLERTVHVYHYTSRARLGLPSSGYIPPDEPRGTPFLEHKIERFWDPSMPVRSLPGERGAFIASGLYAGPDPVRSRGFGGAGDTWVGIRIALPAGLRYVDVRGGELSSAARQESLASGCDAETPHYLLLTNESAACRALARRILPALDVDAIVYRFARIPFAECGDVDEASFVLLEPSLVAADRVALFTSEYRADDAMAVERARIRDLFLRAAEIGATRRTAPWDGLNLVPDDMNGWMREHLFGCQPIASSTSR